MESGSQELDEPALNLRTAAWLVLRAPDSYGLVLLLLVVSFILAPAVSGVNWLWVRVLVQGATMMFALHTSRVHPRTMRVAALLFGISLLLALGVALSGGTKEPEGTIEALLALLFAVSVPAMLRRILTAPDVGVEIVVGALDVYIIFGLYFSALYASIAAFSSTPFFTKPATVNPGSYQFFSFVTLTTVGYGNLVPATYLGQSLAVMEALFGQIYLVTLVARLVSGMQTGGRRHARERLTAERQADERRAMDDSVSAADADPPEPTESAGKHED
jgi:hypothetical protein